MQRYGCSFLKANGEPCKLAAQPGRTTCKRHADHGHEVTVLKSRKRRAVTGYRDRQHADRGFKVIG